MRTVYFDPIDGKDSGEGTAEDPKKTVQAAIDVTDTWSVSVPYEVGDQVITNMPQFTRWNRFLRWLTGRPIPTKREVYECVDPSD